MKTKEEFLTSSINDIQGAIRALDAKFFGTVVIFLLPFTELDKTIDLYRYAYTLHPYVMSSIICLMILSWSLGILFSLLGIYSIGNPSEKVKSKKINEYVSGDYYQPNLFKMGFWNSLFTFNITSQKTFEKVKEDMNEIENRIFNELVFEQMKLTYIRELKLSRNKFSMIFLTIFIFSLATSITLSCYF